MKNITYRQAKVSIDGSRPLFDAILEPNTWNGWACPWFTHEVAYQVMEGWAESYADLDGYTAQWHYEPIEDNFVWRTDPADEWETCPTFTENGVTYYGIGNGSWVWQEDN